MKIKYLIVASDKKGATWFVNLDGDNFTLVADDEEATIFEDVKEAIFEKGSRFDYLKSKNPEYIWSIITEDNY